MRMTWSMLIVMTSGVAVYGAEKLESKATSISEQEAKYAQGKPKNPSIVEYMSSLREHFDAEQKKLKAWRSKVQQSARLWEGRAVIAAADKVRVEAPGITSMEFVPRTSESAPAQLEITCDSAATRLAVCKVLDGFECSVGRYTFIARKEEEEYRLVFDLHAASGSPDGSPPIASDDALPDVLRESFEYDRDGLLGL